MLNASPSPGARSRHIAWGVFALALVVRLLHLRSIADEPFFNLLMGDAAGYDAWAREIAGGDLLGSEVFYQAPLYPYFLALIYALGGGSTLVARVVQAVLGAAACVLLAGAGRRFFSPPVGVGAGVLLALYAPAIFFDGLIQKSAVDLFLMCLLLWLLSRVREDPRPRAWLYIGLALGALILTRENALILVLPLCAWLWRHGSFTGRRLMLGGVFALGLALVLLPVALRNLAVGGEFHLTTSQFGSNLYIGNHPGADGSYTALRPGRGSPRYERVDATELAERAAGRALSPSEVSSYWTGRVLEYVRTQPGDWLRLMGRKFALLWNAVEPVDVEDLYTYSDRSWVLRLTGAVVHFGLIVPLALFGMLATWERRERLWPLYPLIAIYAASVVAFYVFARYRYPLVPLLTLFAAAGAVEAVDVWRRQPRRRVLAWVAATLAVAVVCNRPVLSRDHMRATTLNNLGGAFREAGDPEQAARHYEQALAIVPDYPQAHFSLGVLAQLDGRMDAAIDHYRKSVELSPGYAMAQSNLAGLLLARGEIDDAMRHAELALAVEPDLEHARATLADAHFQLGNRLAGGGRLEASIPHFRAALLHKPDFGAALGNLVRVLRGSGRIVEALAELERSAERNPQWTVPLTGRAWILATHPDAGVRDPETAVRLAEHAVRLTRRGDARSLDILAAALAAGGRFEDARATAQAALGLATAAGNDGLAARIRGRIELYGRGLPFIDSSS